MSKLSSLLRATMSDGVQLFNYRAKTERSRRTMPLLLGLLTGIMMLFSAIALTSELKGDGIETTILSLYTIITTVIIVMEGVYKSGDLLFKPRDNDMLLAMPIPRSTIVFARIIKFYLFEMLYCLIFLLPAIIAYIINVDVSASFYFLAITMLILVPVIPIAVSCLIGLVSSAVSSRFKHKTFLQVVFSFIILFAFAAIILMANTTSDFDGRSLATFSDGISAYYYPASAFVDLATNFDLWQYLIFVVVNLAVLAVTVFIISRFYFQIVTRLSTAKRTENVVAKFNFKEHSQTFAIVKKEITKYFNTPVLLTNTAVGLVLYVVVVGALCFQFEDFATSMTSSGEFPLTVDEIRSFLPSVAFGLVAFTSLMTFITTTMLSLEGKAFNLLKSMPISGRKVLMTKVLSAMLLIVPVTALGVIAMCLRFQFGIVEAILVLIGVIATPLVTELIGILIDLKYARFDAESDAVVVKQSAGVLVSTFLGLGMVLVTISLTFILVFITGQITGLAMMDAIFVIVALFLYFTIATRGEEKYSKLSA